MIYLYKGICDMEKCFKLSSTALGLQYNQSERHTSASLALVIFVLHS